jgi:BMFP domain-containing protein YqiC
MIDPKQFDQQFDEIAKRLSESLPPGMRQMQADVEKNVRSGLHSLFSRMDLVTREEFDVQQAVLERTRSRLEALERQVALLEQQLSATQSSQLPTDHSSAS